MSFAQARRGAGHAEPPTRIAAALDMPHEVRELARHIAHAAELARIAAEGPEPEHGASYLLDTLADLRPRLLALQARVQQHGT